ncbi:MAG: polyprenyl synthetase family protein [Gammaproteobacteria bacterium]|nr:polyprenyl synthetase family protein [Gammaproteobacteria bacterium]
MEPLSSLEQALETAVSSCETLGCPPRLAAAIRYAVFPGGARIRPRLCLAIAAGCGEPHSPLAEATAASIELLHCASLVHDDLPCFDDAETRRNRPSVHRAFDERIALLVGDALIVLAFQNVARAFVEAPDRLPGIVLALARAAGAPVGIVAGQAWECEVATPLEEYRRLKTGALFVAATVGGALSAGSDPAPWRVLGERLGEAYQVADDIRDALGTEEELGKPAGKDEALGRPSAVTQFGLAGAVKYFEGLIAGAAASIPPCPGAEFLRELVDLEAQRLLPEQLLRRAA